MSGSTMRRTSSHISVKATGGFRWWDWPVAGLREIVPLFNVAPVAELIAYGKTRVSRDLILERPAEVERS
jgi:hypothetical protein